MQKSSIKPNSKIQDFPAIQKSIATAFHGVWQNKIDSKPKSKNQFKFHCQKFSKNEFHVK